MPTSLGSESATRQGERAVGKFVAIWGQAVVGPWESYQAALQSGYDEFGMAPFLVKRVEAAEAATTRKRRTAA
jgi:hypothetical protein